ncbi:hypothetical protein DYH09_09655 [bacterium CPR1]|nr:hypothetical protein [bacterium CPR1]
MNEKRANLVLIVLLGLVVALLGGLLIQALLRFVTEGLLKSLLGGAGLHLAILITAGADLVLVLLFIGGLAVLLPQTLFGPTVAADRDEPEGSEWRWLLRAAGVLGILAVLISLHTYAQPEALAPAAAKFAYGQLVTTLIWSALALTLALRADPLVARIPTPWEIPPGRLGQMVWLAQHLALGGLLVGLTLYALSVSNFLYLLSGVHPSLSQTLYAHGFKAGILLAMLLTLATRGFRLPLVTGFLVDWLGPLLFPGWMVPLFQFLAITAATMLTRSPFLAAWRMSTGMCAGRLLGRAVGFLLLGTEGVVLMEPLSEVTLGVLSAPRAEES